MKLNLKDIIDERESSISFDENVNLDRELVGENVVLPVRVVGNIYGDSESGVLTGEVIFSYNDECGRCLKDTTTEIRAELNAGLVRGQGSTEDEEDSEVEYTEDEVFIEKFLSEVIVTSSPMRIICSEDCKGICPECGANQNDEQCNCEIDDVDPRLAKLKDFFE